MKISRRNFLSAVSASLASFFPLAKVAVAGGLSGSLFDKVSTGTLGGDALSNLGWISFYPYLNTDFVFAVPGSRRGPTTRLTLMAMTGSEPVGKKPSDSDPLCFVLTFKGRLSESASALRQDTYTVEHFALGRFDLFLSEGNLAGEDYHYTAVINRLVG
jgi:hypothetical protein